MKDYELLDAMGDINEKFIKEASASKNTKKTWKKWAAAAACLCIIAAGAYGAHVLTGAPPKDTDQLTPPDDNAVADTDPAAISDPAESGGVFIPGIVLPKSSHGTANSMKALVVYHGGIYTDAESYFGEDAEKIDALVGEHLGFATGSIDEWSDPDEYEKEFAGTVAGDIYSVSGYDTEFRVCLRQETEDENGEPVLWIMFLDRLNGIRLSDGGDLFEDRLNIRNRVEKIRWQSHDDWNWNKGGFRDATLEDSLWDDFLDAVDSGEFVNTWDPNRNFYDSKPNSSIYDTPNQAHLYLDMEDGTTVQLRLIEGGYVGYAPLGWYFVKVPGELFDSVYDACGGTHIADWQSDGR